MKLYGGKQEPEEKDDRYKKTAREPEEKNMVSKPSKKKTVQRRRTLIVLLSAFAVCTVVFLLFNIFIRPPKISVENPQTTDADGNVVSNPQGQEPTVSAKNRKEEYFTFMICGVDIDGTRADTIMIASYDVPNGKVNIMNVPRDTIVDTNRKIKKINGAFGGGVKHGGPEQLKKELKNVIGIPIDRYIVVNFKGFEEIIDAIGGVKYNVPVRMKYDDPTQDLHIDLQPGEQILNGKKALHFVRFRKCNYGEKGGYPEGDIGRIKAQQAFIQSVIKQIASPSKIFKLNDICKAIFDNTTTDMPLSEIVWLGMKAVSMDSENISMATMPGEDKYLYEADYGAMQSYFIPNGPKILEYVNANLNPYTTDVKTLHLKDISGYGTSKNNSGSSSKPTAKPTEKPTEAVTEKPTEKPTEAVTEKPTEKPTEAVTEKPTEKPTEAVTEKPTEKPTEAETTKNKD